MNALSRSLRLAVIREMCGSGEAKQIRVLSGVSLSEIARDVGVTPNAVWSWENQRRSPQGDAAVRYGEVLELLRQRLDGLGVLA